MEIPPEAQMTAWFYREMGKDDLLSAANMELGFIFCMNLAMRHPEWLASLYDKCVVERPPVEVIDQFIQDMDEVLSVN